ncbi:hypothetical protein [Streptomyces sp. NPDC058434]|uniref:hypothetical protein n=1 Tax=Streptomyces sp. NPDC058434 TaxID=3346498 RepID=UPI00365E8B1C
MTLTRGARATGAVLCAVLAALAASWIVRDLRTADDLSALWWFWAGDGRTLLSARQLTTTLHDPLLLLGCAVAGLAALRSRAAAGALVAAAVVTFAVRLPGLWLLSAHWMDLRATGELRGRALVSVFMSLAVAVGLIITVVAGRRPAHAPLGATAYGASSQEPPHGAGPCAPGTPHPSRGALLTVFVLLTAAAAVRAAWEWRAGPPSRTRRPWTVSAPGIRTGGASPGGPLTPAPGHRRPRPRRRGGEPGVARPTFRERRGRIGALMRRPGGGPWAGRRTHGGPARSGRGRTPSTPAGPDRRRSCARCGTAAYRGSRHHDSATPYRTGRAVAGSGATPLPGRRDRPVRRLPGCASGTPPGAAAGSPRPAPGASCV